MTHVAHGDDRVLASKPHAFHVDRLSQIPYPLLSVHSVVIPEHIVTITRDTSAMGDDPDASV